MVAPEHRDVECGVSGRGQVLDKEEGGLESLLDRRTLHAPRTINDKDEVQRRGRGRGISRGGHVPEAFQCVRLNALNGRGHSS